MEIGMIGLGRMWGNMTIRLLQGGHQVVVWDRNPPKVQAAAAKGAKGADTIEDLARMLMPPRAAWIMLPAGDPTEVAVARLQEAFSPGDLIIDGGNSNYKRSLQRAGQLRERGISFLDVGTSGGIWGLTQGYGLMVGGEAQDVARLRPVFETLAPAPDQGWGHVGPSGSGHFVKMVHNGIEYGLMQAYAEGFEILRSKPEFGLDNSKIAEIWRHGSVVRSWLLDLAANALKADPSLSGIKGWVADSGEGRWTVAEAIELEVPAPVITLSLLMRFVSRQEDSYAAKLLAALRAQFGGHPVQTSG